MARFFYFPWSAAFEGSKAVGLKSIMRREGRRRRKLSVTWPEVYVRGAELESRSFAQPSAESPGGRPRLRELRLPFLVLETIVIPLRVAFPELLARSIVATVLDVVVDLVEACSIRQRFKRLQAADAGPGEEVAPADADEATGRFFPRYGVRMAAIGVASIGLLHACRIVYACMGDVLPFVLAQIVRCVRVYDLLSYVREINSDLSTNVRALALSKFGIVLLFTPHYLACVWIVLSGGWWHVLGQGRVELPSWPAQFFAESHNPQMDPNSIGEGNQCARPLDRADPPRCACAAARTASEDIIAIVCELPCMPRNG
jgi:hypothetical protein